MTAPYRIPFDHDPDWNKVGGGNWDDAANPFHGDYAYDFGFPEGHKIRAARSGTVIDVVSDRVKGVDVSAGAGGGNFIYVRHIDGTVASYAHLATNRVFVGKGDWVNQGQVIAEAGSTGQSDSDHLHFQVMTFANSEKDCGASIPILFEDAAHQSWRPKSGDTVQSNNTVLRQENWRWCKKCQGLFFGGASAVQGPVGTCAGGGGHDASQSGCYALPQSPTLSVLPIQTQGKWYWCRKCQALFFGGNPGSKCPAGTAHDKSGSGEYFVSMSASFNTGQEGWRWCSKCQSLFLGTASTSRCPAGGSHSATGSGQYTLHQVAELNFAQTGWRYCHKCKGLFFAKNAGSVCPKDQQPHESGGNPYTVLFEAAPVAGQKGWRWCRKCQGMFFGDKAGSVCPAGGSHDKTGSGHYLVYHETPKAPGQAGWRWCSKCQGLFFGEVSGSVCPAGGAHSKAASGNYTVTDL
jgi:Zn finger protein HypA/HybF involved in hydrogenase expression